MAERNIVIFDFCETLVNFQTADAFVNYVRDKLNNELIDKRECINQKLRKYKILFYLERMTRYKLSLLKRIKLYQLRGVSKDVLEELSMLYYQELIKPNLINKTNEILKKYIQDGFEVWIVSGGYGIYLRHYVEEFNVSKLISSNIEIKENKCTGFLDGLDCMNKNKVILTMKEIGESKVNILASYSDSITDIPILSLARHPFVISKTKQKWAFDNNFREIVI